MIFSSPLRVVICFFVLFGATAAVLAQSPNAVPVVTADADREVVTETLPLSGTVTARQAASLSPRTSGLVAKVHVDAGSFVEAGDVLLSLDPALARLAVETADAERMAAQTQLGESERLLAEARRLLVKNSIPETEVLTREATLRTAQANAQRAEATYREQAELLKRHDVVAPFAGVITHRHAEAGEWVSTGVAVLRLVDLDGARVDVQVPQERLTEINPDTPVDFVLDSAPSETIAGRVVAQVPVSDPGTRTGLVRLQPTDSSIRLSPGKSARVTFRLRSDRPVLTVPRDALIRRADGTVTLWVARPEGEQWLAQAVRVDLGLTFSDRIEIVGGLEPGQKVVVRGNETLQEGQSLRLVSP